MKKEVCNLANSHCIPCKGGLLSMTRKKAQSFLQKLKSGWIINDLGHLYKEFIFYDFISTMKFANSIASIIE